jgi:predicted polyphosphate/ATP-dependent NAD kinase
VQGVGIIANPVSGKDIRRLLASAPTSTVQEKYTIVRRVVLGAAAVGVRRFHFLAEPHHLCARAVETLSLDGVEYHTVANAGRFDESDTVATAAAMQASGCGVVVVLGGDGTNRAVARGWRDAPVLPISTGTNNVFPRFVEATVAGQAAGLVATGRLGPAEVTEVAKVVEIVILDADGAPVDHDLALVDAALLDERIVGSRALFDPARIRTILLSRAEPAAVGLSCVGGLVRPCGPAEDGGVLLRLEPPGGAARRLRAPLAPGWYAELGLAEVRAVADGEEVVVHGPGVLALDGERQRFLAAGHRAVLTVRRNGPHVIDVDRAMHLAAARGVFSC